MSKPETLIVCDCAGSMKIDADALQKASGATNLRRCHTACTQDMDVVVKALHHGGLVLMACGQEAARFETLAAELNVELRAELNAKLNAKIKTGNETETGGQVGPLVCADIRDRAGWSDDAPATPKQAALLAEALLPTPMTPLIDITSAGTCLVIGPPEVALAAAERLAEAMTVTCLINAPAAGLTDLVPPTGFDVAVGRVRRASGSLGRFAVTVDGFAPLLPTGRAATFAAPRDGGRSDCDVIVDFTGATSLFPAPEKRDGYLRAAPDDAPAVARALFDAAQLVGSFEKPLYVNFDPNLCAHSRAGQAGCTRCLDVCPTGAILPDGDTVVIDPNICAGCGGCAAVCPSGAASYDDPDVGHLFARLRTLASAYRAANGAAGGTGPRLLFHDAEFGAEMIRLSARFGRGLPADVIPLAVNNIEGVGHAELLAALGVGFAQVSVLASPKSDRDAPVGQMDIARAITGREDTLTLLDVADPDALETALFDAPVSDPLISPILPLGGRREVTRSTATALRGADHAPLPLPAGAPYGQVTVDTDACTLCLACASLCPVGALGDNPDKPQLTFQETACLQCGICAHTCPENAITLTPRLDLSPQALGLRILNEEEPFACIECGKLFGVRSAIERVVQTLEGKHWMFQNSDNVTLIQMCDDCRIRAQYHSDNSPFRMGERPRTRTTEDYLKERDKEKD